MNILVVSQYFYPESFRVNDLVQTLVASGHKVTVLTGQPNYPNGDFFAGYGPFSNWRQKYQGAEVLRVPIFPRGKGRRWELMLNYFSFVFFAMIFGLPRLWRRRFDAQFVFATSPITAAIPSCVLRKLRGWPLMIWVQDLWPESVVSVNAVKSSFLVRGIGAIVRWIYRNSDRLMIPSQGFRESVLRWGGVESQLRFFPNWADEMDVPEGTHSAGPAFKVLFAGNMGHAQSLDVIVEAAAIARDVEWHMMGDGSRKKWMEDESSRRGMKNIFFHKSVPMDEMPLNYQKYDALLVSLKKDPIMDVVLPSKVQSVLAAGKPILASGGSEIRRVLESANCGLTAEPGDAKQLAAMAQKMSAIPDGERREMGRRGREYFKANFRKNKLIPILENHLKEMVEQA